MFFILYFNTDIYFPYLHILSKHNFLKLITNGVNICDLCNYYFFVWYLDYF